MAELADAHGSGPCGSNTLRVRLPSSAGDEQEVRKLASCFLLSGYFEEDMRKTSYSSALHLLARLQRTRSFGRLPYEDLAPKALMKTSFQRTFNPKSSQG